MYHQQNSQIFLYKIRLKFCLMLLSTYCWILGICFVLLFCFHAFMTLRLPSRLTFFLFFFFLSQILIILCLGHSKCLHSDTLTYLLLCHLCGCRTEWLSGDVSDSCVVVVMCLLRSSWIIFNSFFIIILIKKTKIRLKTVIKEFSTLTDLCILS